MLYKVHRRCGQPALNLALRKQPPLNNHHQWLLLQIRLSKWLCNFCAKLQTSDHRTLINYQAGDSFHIAWLCLCKIQISEENSPSLSLYHTCLLLGHRYNLSSALWEEGHPNGWGCLQRKDEHLRKSSTKSELWTHLQTRSEETSCKEKRLYAPNKREEL